MSELIKDDLSDVLEEFQNWKTNIDKIGIKVVQLEELLLLEKMQQKENVEKIAVLDEEKKHYNSSVSNLQKTVENLLDAEKENNRLKETIKSLEEKHQNMLLSQKENAIQFNIKLNDNVAKEQLQREEIKSNYEKNLQELKENFLEKLSAKELEIGKSKQKCEEIIKMSSNEIFNFKLAQKLEISKLKEELNQAQQKARQTKSSTNQEIFRQKLQHIQADFQNKLQIQKNEIERLKYELQQKSTAAADNISKRGPPPKQNVNRKRKLYNPIETVFANFED